MRLIFFVVYLLATLSVSGQDEMVWLHPNRGQWNDNIQYKTMLAGGEMYLEKQGFTYHFHNASEVYHRGHDNEHHKEEKVALRGHVVRSYFTGANTNARVAETGKSSDYRNYFLGNDASKWKSEIYSVEKVVYTNFYPAIDLEVAGGNAQLKYSFIVAPGADPAVIRMQTEGAKKIFLDEEGNLHTKHSLGEIVESAPTAWTVSADGRKTKVPVKFFLKKKTITYVFPEGYNRSEKLVIDPQLTFSTFTGATVDNWGFTAAPDAAGNVFAAGIVFGAGYPITTGAYDASYNGGNFDIGVTKFNATGTSLIYSTYIGGAGNETPHSIICNPANELYIMGATSSNDFPMPGTPYDASFNGGPPITENGLSFNLGADIYVARLNNTGTSLLSATFVGGSGTDGINIGTLVYNYGDQFRGDIALDAAGNIYVASTTGSANFPTPNGFQIFRNGAQDAVIFKLNNSLSNLLWSSYFGGGGLETGNSLQVSNGNIYMAGGTTSSSLGFPAGHLLTSQGGLSDGYVLRINAAAAPFIASGSFMGTNEYDQTYFVQLDADNKVYVLGQTEGNMPITAGLYGVANSGQFIRKYSTNLATLEWNTVIGAGTGHVEISPTAFLISDCYDIYISGWGGPTQSGNQAIHSSTNGFPVTQDAFQPTTNGNNFYIAVLSGNAGYLKYGTFMGGLSNTPKHVDGGTSRFDKTGRIYHAVCGACGGAPGGFTTTPGVWSTTNKSTNCNLAAFKFELSHITAAIIAPNTLICIPNPIGFSSTSFNGNTFHWDFGDNTTSNSGNAVHTYSAGGTYNVTLIVSDSMGCFSPDTARFTVNIGEFNGGVVLPTSAICPGTPYELSAYGGTNYSWTPANLLNNATIPNPIATITETTEFTVIVSDSCGVDTLKVTLEVLDGGAGASSDTSICIGNSVPLFATGGGTYSWTPPATLSDPTSSNPIATPTETTIYNIVITTPSGCVLNESVEVEVVLTVPQPVMPDTLLLCQGLSRVITVSGASSYQWSPLINISPATGPIVTVNPTQDILYYCNFINACGEVLDSVFIDLVEPNIQAGYDTIICPGQSTPLFASGGVSYTWHPATTLNTNTGDQVIAKPVQNTLYHVIGTDVNGCLDSATVMVELFPAPFIQTSPDVYAFIGDEIKLSATSTTPGPYVWYPAEYLSCVVCPSPITKPDQEYVYTVTYTDANGCSASDDVHIFYDPIIYVPNTFTPDDNKFNELFKAMGGNIKSFEMTIYNRWGEKIATLVSLDDSWDGTYKDLPCPDGTYVWNIKYTDLKGNEKKMVGHINLLR